MYRWILSLLALLGYTGIAVQAQQAPHANHATLTHSAPVDAQHANVIGDGSTAP